MHLRFSDTAEADLDNIYTEIAKHNPVAARRIVDSILGAAYHPRELSVPRTSYFIVYTLPDEFHIDIETIIHDRQQFPPVSE